MTLPRENCAPYKLIQQFLMDERLSVLDLSKKLGITRGNTRQYIVLLRERGLVRVAEYKQGRTGPAAPLYELGKKDAPQPVLVPLTNTERSAKHLEKHRAQVNAKKRAIRAKKSGKTIPTFTKMLQSLGFL